MNSRECGGEWKHYLWDCVSCVKGPQISNFAITATVVCLFIYIFSCVDVRICLCAVPGGVKGEKVFFWGFFLPPEGPFLKRAFFFFLFSGGGKLGALFRGGGTSRRRPFLFSILTFLFLFNFWGGIFFFFFPGPGFLRLFVG